jgi:hypothetical protein
MKYLTIFGCFFLFFFAACKEPIIEYPPLSAPLLIPSALTEREIDKNRLCLGEIVSKLCENGTFLEHVKDKTSTQENLFNLEYNLLANLSTIITPGSDLKSLISQVINQQGSSCFSSIEELTQVLSEDPLLVLKIPDIINIQDWNTSLEIPFVYVETTSTVRNPSMLEQYGFLGIHYSGAIDFYNNGHTRFFPLVLKNSEDMVAMDRYLNCHNGVQFDQLHSSFNRLSNPEDILGGGINIQDSELTLIKINSLLENSNRLSELYLEPREDTVCVSQCFYSCVSPSERHVLGSEMVLHNINSNVMSHEFKSAFRPGERIIFRDNIIPLLFLKHIRQTGAESQKSVLLGSFRLNQLFSVLRSHETTVNSYSISNDVVVIAETQFSVDVLGKTALQAAHNLNLVLVDGIVESDQLTLSTIRLSLDRPTQNTPIIEGFSLLIHEAWRDNVLNYDLFCLDRDGMLGFNSIALKYDF